MSENLFRFKQFEVLQNKSAMKVGTDGVLVGAVANCAGAKTILDVGTGTGLIAIMMAQKSQAEVHAIDINEDAVELAKYNVSKSPFSNRIVVHNTSLQTFSPQIKFDLIISNPPYFSTNVIAPDKNRATARHNLQLTIADLVMNVKRLLSESGRAVVIFPVAESGEYEKLCEESGLFVNAKVMVSSFKNSEPIRVISEVSNCKTETEIVFLAIENEKRHDFTEEYKRMTADFYLKF